MLIDCSQFHHRKNRDSCSVFLIEPAFVQRSFLTMRGSSSSSRLSKRSRASDAAPNDVAHTDDDRTKRRRFSQNEHVGLDATTPELLLQGSTRQDRDVSVIDEVPSQSLGEIRAPWALSQLVAGQYSNIEPVFSSDEK